jgi:cobalt-zinc-cadmium efflux system outer membrane protein
VPQADADIVTAGLRTNPLLYLVGQFIPYGFFTDATPGGPTQYDVNITYPVDVSHKRQSRTIVARMARTALEELTSVALTCRPDIRSMRAGVSRANAEVALQRANRFDDIYLFYDPITIQDNRPIHAPSSKSWAVAVTFALPIYNRNQGNISRAISNVQQTRQELSSMERRVASEVRLAEREYQTSKRALVQIEKTMLPQLQASLRRRAEQFAKGDISLEDYQSHVEESTEVAQSHRDALIRQRRSMVDLNTAVGLRVLP